MWFVDRTERGFLVVLLAGLVRVRWMVYFWRLAVRDPTDEDDSWRLAAGMIRRF